MFLKCVYKFVYRKFYRHFKFIFMAILRIKKRSGRWSMNVKEDFYKRRKLGVSFSGNLIYGIRSMESFDFLRSKNIQALHVCAIARAYIDEFKWGTQEHVGSPCWPVRPALRLYVCAFSAIMCDRNGGPDRSRSSIFRFFIVGKMRFRALIIAHIFRFWMHTRAHGGTLSSRQLLSQLYFFCYQIAPIIVASYNRTFSFSTLC